MSDATFVYAVLFVAFVGFLGIAALIDELIERRRARRTLPPPTTVDYRNVVNLNNYRVLTRSGRTHANGGIRDGGRVA